MEVRDEVGAGTFYQFDEYTLDPGAKTLRYDDKLIELTPKVYTTLLVLIANRDKVLTKDELLATIWPDQFVDQSNLSQNISVLRKSLGEMESGKKYIATFTGRGYRFVGHVEVRHGSQAGRAALPPPPVESAQDQVPAIPGNIEPFSVPDSSRRSVPDWSSASIIAVCVLTLAGIIAFAIGKRDGSSRPNGAAQDETPVKTFARMNAPLAQPAWSRDGKTMAFISTNLNGTSSAIFVQSTGDIQPHRLVSDSGQFSSPAWSPDGRQLAFLHFGTDTAELVIFDTQKKSSNVLTKLFAHRYGLNYRHLDWSPDGKFLVVDDKAQDSEPFSLYLIYVAGGQRIRLTYPDSDMIGDVSPRVSPDSAGVAFIRDIDPLEQDIYVTKVRGRTYQKITSTHTLISDVGWRMNKKLVFTADNGDGFKFWQVDLSERSPKEVPASQVSSDRALQFSISQSGRAFAFSNYAPDLDIWSINITDPTNGWTQVIQAPGENIHPSLSPDGRLLAFLSNVSGHFQVWTSDPDGTNASAVPTGKLVPASFCWSPSGKSIVFSPQGVHGLYEVSVRGGASVRQITSVYTDPLYGADAKSLFARAHLFIYRVPLPNGNAQEMTEQGGAPIAQSRDGRYLYFPQGRMNTTIARLDARTGHQDELIRSLVPGYSDTWALSPQGIYFLGQEKNRPTISFFRFATNSEENIADFPGELPPIEMSGFGVSPDGKRLWVVRATPSPSDIKVAMF